ncbi:3-hydroxyacyl-CoA dehydrogenase [soil metagenome]
MHDTIAVIGAGLIGRAWAIVFARAGLRAALFDPDAGALARARGGVAASLGDLRAAGLIDDPAPIAARIAYEPSLAAAVQGVAYVQECGPESLEMKRGIYAELEAACAPETILASSTSSITASRFAAHLARPERCLVAHPVNPPSLIPLVEVVPGPQTCEAAVTATMAVMERAGQTPILVRQEIAGFVLNRLQGALLNEALRLYRGGYASAEDIDRTVRDGLGRRWAFMGPFETIDLNAPGGVAEYARRYGPIFAALDAERDGAPWEDAVIARLTQEMRARRPVEDLPERHGWRDRQLMALAAHLGRADDDGGS